MRILIATLIIFTITSCALKVNEEKAKSLTESLLTDLKNQNYENLDKYYTSSFNESETRDQKIQKYKRLHETLGDIQSFELLSSKQNYDSDRGINEMELKYKVICTKIPVEETFLVINDEGDEKIMFQNIENLK